MIKGSKLAGLLLALSASFCGSASGQGGGPANTVAFGQGPGRSFGFVGPCASGVPFIGAGAGTPPACHSQPMSAYALTSSLSVYALLASPVFTGNPTGPTPAVNDNDTSLATTAFVQSMLAARTAVFDSRLNAIAATIPTFYTTLFLTGYSAAADSGYGAFYTTIGCPATTAPDFQSADGRCWHLNVATPTLGMFGADPTGAADSTTPVNNFISYTYGGNKCGKFGKGTFKVAGPITITSATNPGNGFCLDGEGIDTFTAWTCFNNTNLASDTFRFDLNGGGMNGGRLTNIAFCHASAKTGGWEITQTNATVNGMNGGFYLDNIQIGSNAWGGINWVNSFNFRMENLYIYGIGADQVGLNINGNGTTGINGGNFRNLFLLNGTGSTTTTAIKIGDKVAGLEFVQCHGQGGAPTAADYGIWISGTTNVDFIHFDQCYMDAFRKNSIRVDGGTQVQFNNATAMNAGNGFSCIRIAGSAQVTIIGYNVFDCQRHGIEVLGSTGVDIIGNKFWHNGYEGAGFNNYDDVFIAADVKYVNVVNNNFCANSAAAGVNVRYNVNVATGASNYYNIHGNMTGATSAVVGTGCHRTAGVADAGTGTIKSVFNNTGAPWQTWTPTVSCGAGTPTTITAAGRYEQSGSTVKVNVTLTLTNIGTCTTTLRFTTPTTTQGQAATLTAVNTTTFVAKIAMTAAAIARIDVLAPGVVFPGVNGDVIVVTGFYETVAP